MTILAVNGKRRQVQSPPETPLLVVLREELGLTGTKYGCGEGECGACTILLGGRAVRSCRTPLSAAAGKEVVTVEGLERRGRLHPVQEAFLKAEAFQCGYCTPGMILSAVELLQRNRAPREEEIVSHMQGNICRCGTYGRIIAAVGIAAETMRREGSRERS
jgi:aerobic-type carbon monoxide dehydrogenase small subunit (CoxS/CutS family)